ncbi:ABC transporter permease [Ohtaekwangia sp.]|uniref:ABC transporter permease n=1 Tax=Ohtaekwangia sp. TaxID=2066019 RepID=UPI002F956833
MKQKDIPPTPPAWATRWLQWYCRPEILEDLEGDLHEYFDRNVKAKGVRRARFIYILDVLKFFRIYTVRRPQFLNLIIQWIMIGSYIKTSGRSIVRNKLFSAINIIGLAISMSVGLLVISFLSDLLSYDSFHEKKAEIYRVNTTDERNGNSSTLATSSVKAGKSIRETITGIEDVTLMRRGFDGDAAIGENVFPIGGFWADDAFFTVFTFPLVQGNAHTALKEPYSLVITETTARKLFGNTNALGQSVKIGSDTYAVTGVMKDIPKLSHMHFDVLVSFSTIETTKADQDGDLMNWESIYSNYTYITIPDKKDIPTIQAGLNKLAATENTALQNRQIQLELMTLAEIPFQGNLGNPIGPSINKIALWILGGLSAVVILSACFNYTNLSIARSLRRSREVGIRKVIGARRSHVLGQFMAESVIIALLALSVSFLLFLALRTQFLLLAPQLQELVSLQLTLQLVGWFIVLAIVVGLASGILPALFFARINAIRVLKDVSSMQVFRHVTLRKALIVVQYTFSLIFITTTIIGYNQYKSFLTFDLGFTTENILNINLNGVNSDQLAKELEELPEVTGISRSLMVTSLGSIYGTQIKYSATNDSAGVWINRVDENFLPLHKHELLAGRNLHAKPDSTEESEVIVNEQVLKRFNIANRNPARALGEEIILENKKLTIVGVLKDFHYGTLMNDIEPLIICYATSKTYGYLNVKIASHDLPATLASIDKAWHKLDKVHPLDARFYDDQIQEAYNQFSVMVKVIGFLSFLAVGIASMGLFGMVVFTAETRLKEISIRKVLGASEMGLMYLLSRGFLVLLIISALVALPATYLLFDRVILTKFAYHQPVGIGELFTGLLIVIALAGIMISSQTLKVAKSNPATVLKSE